MVQVNSRRAVRSLWRVYVDVKKLLVQDAYASRLISWLLIIV
jgi:hypothetical protein